MEVKIYYKKGTYTNSNGEERQFTNFYAQCGQKLIPIEVKYFSKDGHQDPQYATRKALLEAFAEPLPEDKA